MDIPTNHHWGSDGVHIEIEGRKITEYPYRQNGQWFIEIDSHACTFDFPSGTVIVGGNRYPFTYSAGMTIG